MGPWAVDQGIRGGRPAELAQILFIKHHQPFQGKTYGTGFILDKQRKK